MTFLPHFIALTDSKSLVQQLYSNIQWRHDELIMYGKRVKVPRLQAWYGDQGTDYTYTQLTMSPLPWTEQLLMLKQQVSNATGAEFNSVLANCYRNHQDSVAWHSDDEPELGETPVIASLSLGAERFFHLKHKVKPITHKFKLPSGSLLIMKGNTQKYWQHAVLKSRIHASMRINLTFRKIIK
ncbi:alpha-ketoglutarate-dependent dioxygenase AlkB [Thalassotalea sp. 1_MG-2023]|uniref:alpha-ketoglutarate-dependent dioxygenase AlkB family protein n=1 Tax=Thalassotalea sp. 1_MG-2023 TaxID=3062680 RepID=UPI0026E34FB4|nr:alpha-ketoglutarate-dependent dioxygenase AlkB [Thalassotalea sp. 1_MG-2023]MDO6428639.1 alpha-ketoglutarate-dependent dioxygenase AlkB [Thalassotalea sp. 1_MG-2023]